MNKAFRVRTIKKIYDGNIHCVRLYYFLVLNINNEARAKAGSNFFCCFLRLGEFGLVPFSTRRFSFKIFLFRLILVETFNTKFY